MGEACTNSNQCSANNAECSGKLCVCISGFYDTDGATIGGDCKSSMYLNFDFNCIL